MRSFSSLVLVFFIVAGVAAQSPEPPLGETRLTVHTLLREDVFAGFMANDMTRADRADRNIEQLMKDRPDQKGNLLAWKGSNTLHRAVRAHEAGNTAEFKRQLEAARGFFAAAAKATSGNEGVFPIIGGSYSVFGDRLPKEEQAAAWQSAYDAYSMLWKVQGEMIDKLPVHHRGELLAGLAQSAQRTGRTAEVPQHLDRLLTHLAGTPYEATAKQWKDDPASMAKTTITCKNCHNPGRLGPQLAALKQ